MSRFFSSLLLQKSILSMEIVGRSARKTHQTVIWVPGELFYECYSFLCYPSWKKLLGLIRKMKQAVVNDTDEVKCCLTLKFSPYLLHGEVFIGKMLVMNCTNIQHRTYLSSLLSTFCLGLIST